MIDNEKARISQVVDYTILDHWRDKRQQVFETLHTQSLLHKKSGLKYNDRVYYFGDEDGTTGGCRADPKPWFTWPEEGDKILQPFLWNSTWSFCLSLPFKVCLNALSCLQKKKRLIRKRTTTMWAFWRDSLEYYSVRWVRSIVYNHLNCYLATARKFFKIRFTITLILVLGLHSNLFCPTLEAKLSSEGTSYIISSITML